MSYHKDAMQIKIHGLPEYQEAVRADIFANKLTYLIRALRYADRHFNKKITHEYFVQSLSVGSAEAGLEEKQTIRTRPNHSSIEQLTNIVESIYNNESNVVDYPQGLLNNVFYITHGIDKSFSHAEISYSEKNYRVDKYFRSQVLRAIEQQKNPDTIRPKYFRGTSFGSFEGYLREVDLRGSAKLAALITTAGEKEISCVIDRLDIDEIRNSLNRRVHVAGKIHYSGERMLPERIDVYKIRERKETGDLRKWVGALNFGRLEIEDGEW